MATDFDEVELRARFNALPVSAKLALAAKAARHAERVLREDWFEPNVIDTATRLIAHCENAVANGEGLRMAVGEYDYNSLCTYLERAPHRASRCALQSIRQAASAAMDAAIPKNSPMRANALRNVEYSAWQSVLSARESWAQGAISVEARSSGFQQRSRAGSHDTHEAISSDINLVCSLAKENRWSDDTPLSTAFWSERDEPLQ